MLKKNNTLVMSVDVALHLHDLSRYCKKHSMVQVLMGERFVHTFFDTPIRYNNMIKNYDEQTRLKMFNIQL